jgi:hypothetical protein
MISTGAHGIDLFWKNFRSGGKITVRYPMFDSYVIEPPIGPNSNEISKFAAAAQESFQMPPNPSHVYGPAVIGGEEGPPKTI